MGHPADLHHPRRCATAGGVATAFCGVCRAWGRWRGQRARSRSRQLTLAAPTPASQTHRPLSWPLSRASCRSPGGTTRRRRLRPSTAPRTAVSPFRAHESRLSCQTFVPPETRAPSCSTHRRHARDSCVRLGSPFRNCTCLQPVVLTAAHTRTAWKPRWMLLPLRLAATMRNAQYAAQSSLRASVDNSCSGTSAVRSFS